MSSFLSASNIFLIVILLGLPVTIPTGAFGNTYPMLFQANWFFLIYEKIIWTALNMVKPILSYTIWSLKRCSRLSLGGYRSVLVNATDKPDQKFDFCLGTWFRATEWLVRSLPGWPSSIQSSPSTLTLKFSISVYHQLCDQCNQNILYDCRCTQSLLTSTIFLRSY